MRKWMIRATLLTLSLCCLLFSSDLSVTISFAQEPITCPGFIESRLVVGQTGRVTPGDANNVRAEPSRQAAGIGSIPGEGVFTVLDGPICADDFAWWQVDYNGLVGWTVEGADGEYWLEPYDELCPSQFQIGNEIEVTEYSLGLYSAPDKRGDEVESVSLPEHTVVIVLESPVCGQKGDDSIWLKVEYEGQTGWIEESRVIYCDICEASSRVYFVRRPLQPLIPASADETTRRIQSLLQPGIDSERAITLDNAEQLTLLNTIGDGQITDFAWSPDSTHLAIASSLNVGVYDVRRLNGEPIVVSNFTGTPQSLLYSPDGRLLVVSDSRGQLTLWETQTYGLLSTFEIEVDFRAAEIDFNPDGNLLAVSSVPGGVQVWDITHPDQPDLIYTDAHAAKEVRFVADTDQLVSQGNSDFYLHTPVDRRPPRKFGGVEREIRGWTLSPDGKRLIALTVEVNGDMTVVYATYITHWEVTDDLPMIYAESISLFEPNPYTAYDLEFRSDGRMLLYNLGDIHILEGISYGEPGLNIPQTTDADYAPDDSFIAFGTPNGAIYLVRDREIVDSLFGISGRVRTLSFSPDSRYLAAEGEDNTLRVWDVSARQRLGTVQFEPIPSRPPIISNDGNTVLIAAELRDTLTGQTVETLEHLAERPYSLIFARSNGQFVGIRSSDSDDVAQGTIVSDLRTGEVVGTFPHVTSLADYNADGRFVTTDSWINVDEPYVQVYDTQSGEHILKLERYFDDVTTHALSFNGELLVVEESSKGKLLLWDVRDGTLLAEIPIELSPLRVIFSPDSRKIGWITGSSLAGNSVPSIHVYDIIEQQVVQEVSLPQVASSFYFITFNADGNLIAAGHADGNIYLIASNGTTSPVVIPAHQGGVSHLTFSNNGERLFSVGTDRVLRVWGVE